MPAGTVSHALARRGMGKITAAPLHAAACRVLSAPRRVLACFIFVVKLRTACQRTRVRVGGRVSGDMPRRCAAAAVCRGCVLWQLWRARTTSGGAWCSGRAMARAHHAYAWLRLLPLPLSLPLLAALSLLLFALLTSAAFLARCSLVLLLSLRAALLCCSFFAALCAALCAALRAALSSLSSFLSVSLSLFFLLCLYGVPNQKGASCVRISL